MDGIDEIASLRRENAILRRSAERLATAQRIGRLGDWDVDLRTGAVTWSAELYKIFGRPAAAGPPSGDSWLDYVHEDDRAELRRIVGHTLNAGAPFAANFRIVLGDGAVRHLHAQGELMLAGDGAPANLIGTVQDVTELRQAEQASRAKSMFLATMSHELRTPLNGVVVAAELLEAEALAPQQRHLVQTIRSSSEALQAILSDVLDFAKIEAGHIVLDPVHMSLAQLVEDAVELLAVRAAQKGLEIVAFVDPAAHDHFLADANRLRQVVLNLAGNAVKFTAAGHVAVRAAAAAGGGDKVTVRLEVEDTGIGIPRDRQGSIFSPFVQADRATARRFGGTGLGLAISAAMVEAMGGRIGVDSEEGHGARFWVEVPLQPFPERRRPPRLDGLRVAFDAGGAADAGFLRRYLEAAGADVLDAAAQGADVVVAVDTAPVAAEARRRGLPLLVLGDDGLRRPVRRLELLRALAAATGRATDSPAGMRRADDAPPPTAPRRILLAEDHPTNQQVLRLLLEGIGHSVEVAADGQQALDMLAIGDYDLLISDCHMPVMDGYTLARRIRAQEAACGGHLPIIALTADARADSAAECRSAGMDQWLSKPVSRAQLRQAVDAAGGGAPVAEQAPPLPAEDAVPVLDLGFLLHDVLGGDGTMLAALLDDFVAATGENIAALEAAGAAGEWPRARACSHAAKGAARQAGALRLAAACQAFENAVKDGRMDEAAGALGTVTAAFAEVAAAVARRDIRHDSAERSVP